MSMGGPERERDSGEMRRAGGGGPEGFPLLAK